MSSSDLPTILVIDDTRVHYNTSRDAAQATAPSKAVIDSVNAAKIAPWNFTLTAITSPVSIWYNVINFSRIAVYGPIIPPSGLGVTAWANYTINGDYTAANITTTGLTVTAPLFTSVALDPSQQYNLTIDIWASPDAPYLLDYLLAFSPPSDPTPVSTSTRSTTSSASTVSSTSTGTPAAIPPSSGDSVDIPHPKIIIGALAGACVLLLVMWLVTLCCWCQSRRPKHKAMEESVGPEPLFAPRPTVNTESAALVLTNASRHAESLTFLEPSALPVSASTSAAMTTVPASAPPAISVAAAAAPAPAKLGQNQHSPEEEVRLEPPAAQMQASASSPVREDFADSPPAYSS